MEPAFASWFLQLFSHRLGRAQQEIGQANVTLADWNGIEVYAVSEKSKFSMPFEGSKERLQQGQSRKMWKSPLLSLHRIGRQTMPGLSGRQKCL